MTLEETKKLMITINAIYPNWKVDNPEATVKAWQWALKEYPAEAVNGALQIFLKTDKAGFVPSVSQLIGCMYMPQDKERMTEGEAWALVKKAIQNSGYGSEEEFAKLPPLVQKAVGGAAMLRQWGMTDSDDVNTVIMSNFQRNYRAVVSQQEYAEKVPENVSELVKGLANKATPERIGVKR